MCVCVREINVRELPNRVCVCVSGKEGNVRELPNHLV